MYKPKKAAENHPGDFCITCLMNPVMAVTIIMHLSCIIVYLLYHTPNISKPFCLIEIQFVGVDYYQKCKNQKLYMMPGHIDISKYASLIILYVINYLSLVNNFIFKLWQVSLWDGIIPSKEHAKFQIHTTNKYRLIDQASHVTILLVANYLIPFPCTTSELYFPFCCCFIHVQST